MITKLLSISSRIINLLLNSVITLFCFKIQFRLSEKSYWRRKKQVIHHKVMNFSKQKNNVFSDDDECMYEKPFLCALLLF